MPAAFHANAIVSCFVDGVVVRDELRRARVGRLTSCCCLKLMKMQSSEVAENSGRSDHVHCLIPRKDSAFSGDRFETTLELILTFACYLPQPTQ